MFVITCYGVWTGHQQLMAVDDLVEEIVRKGPEYTALIAFSILFFHRPLGNFPKAECHRFEHLLELGG